MSRPYMPCHLPRAVEGYEAEALPYEHFVHSSKPLEVSPQLVLLGTGGVDGTFAVFSPEPSP